jgi:hypothetical protein
MDIIQLFKNLFKKNHASPGFFTKRAGERIYRKLSPVLERVMEPGEKALGYCCLVRFPYEVFFLDIFNPLFSSISNLVRVWAAKREMVIASDRRLLLLKLTLLNNYGGEAKEILYGSIKSSALLHSRLTGTIKIKLILNDNSEVLLSTTKNQPLQFIHESIQGKIKPERDPEAMQHEFEHHRQCHRCGFVYTALDTVCPSCGFKRFNPALACLYSLIFPGFGQLYIGQSILGTIFISYHIITLCFAYVYIYQWIGRLSEISNIIVLQILLNSIDSTVKAYIAAKELNA